MNDDDDDRSDFDALTERLFIALKARVAQEHGRLIALTDARSRAIALAEVMLSVVTQVARETAQAAGLGGAESDPLAQARLDAAMMEALDEMDRLSGEWPEAPPAA